MSRERTRTDGVVLINALVIVLVIAAITAALLTRAESGRVRAADSQNSSQLDLYLDATEGLIPGILKEPKKAGTADLTQTWATGQFAYAIDRGRVTAHLADLQGRLNVNWLLGGADPWASDTFGRLFAELDVPQSLVGAIADYIRPGGPQSLNSYLARRLPIAPPGGPMRSITELRQVEGMTDAYFTRLAPHVTALPIQTKLNLNTASRQVLTAALAPFPPELIAETLARGRDEPLTSLSEFRNRLIELLETEDMGDLPIERLTVGSTWFQADLRAELDTRSRTRRVILQQEPAELGTARIRYRWTVYE